MLENQNKKPHSNQIKMISLVGMMGSGKSTFGKFLSEKLTYNFYDIDQIIEQKFKISVNKIFEKYGEKYFRDEEKKIIEKTILEIKKNNQNSIISTGGGSFMNYKSRKLLLSNSLVVWLNCPIDDLVKRIGKTNKRPLVKEDIKINLEKIFNKREKFYMKAHSKINTSENSFDEMAKKVIRYI